MSDLSRYLDPDTIQQVGRLDLRARFIVEGFLAGLHRSRFQGLSVEFAEHRKYVAGDDPRTIDWNVFARTDRLYIRKYQAETHLGCHLFVDASASMGFVGLSDGARLDERPAKLLYAVNLAAALGYLVTRQQDAIGLSVIGAGLREVLPPRSRRTDLARLLGVLAAIRPRGRTGLVAGIQAALSQIAHRGVVVLLSDLLTDPDELLPALHAIRYRGHDLIVMHILDAAEAKFPFSGPIRLSDPESGAERVVDAPSVRAAYLTELENWRESLRTQISAMKGDYLPLDTSVRFDRALAEFLVQRSRRR